VDVTTEKTIKLAKDLAFPALRFACEVTTLVGNRGGGKTNGATVIAEQMLDAGVQVIVLDYVGIWYGLRLMPDGKTPSKYDVPILGGRHGDVDLSATAGRVVAEALAERRSAAILDLSEFSKSDRARFATDFAEAFFGAKKKHRGPTLVVLEEAQRFVPQMLYKGQERMLGAWAEIGEVGRNFGVGLLLITQRPQKISKDVMFLSDTVLAFRTNGTLERQAIEKWVQEKGAAGTRDIADQLPELPTGVCYAWCPVRGIFGRYQTRLKSTFDTGATPVEAQDDVVTQPLDLDALVASMGKAAEEVSRGTPSALQAEITRLRRQVAELEARTAVKPVVEQVPVVPSKWRDVVEDGRRRLESLPGQVADLVRVQATMALGLIEAAQENFPLSVRSPVGRMVTVRQECQPARPTEKQLSVERRKVDGGQDKLSKGERNVLAAALQFDAVGGVTREQLSVLCGYSRSSRDTFLYKLRQQGLLEVSEDDDRRFAATGEAKRRYGHDFSPLPEGSKLLEYWKGRLSRGEWNVLYVAVSAYPDAVSREKIDGECGYSRSSRDTFLYKLRHKLLVECQGGAVRASSLLFDCN